ncbi:chemotaxis protein CheB [Leeuwenhoekiella parthenopeia]|uniref:protein-glutamate methylesterase n=1 Tax=Leeuwenhoekiella parthenopeia TaxID=2890320 RepID=A0ABS8GSS9_9FLAO|nr:chemotaxis protein CheB [Leeuwenhoekiella parthenopeia]MCC4212994.1 chemotaxis protein CheB [Leeuwenhoekiella parthenopeia]
MKTFNEQTRIVVIGASAGGFDALRKLLKGFDKEINAAFFVVQHMQSHLHIDYASGLKQNSTLEFKYARHAAPIEPGVVYLAVPDHHLLIDEGVMLLTRGPRENMARPAIDPLFRSAAATYSNRLIGVVLSGMLSDGTSGLHAIKACKGLIGIQDPAEASYPEMPGFALSSLQPDFCCGMEDMASEITRLVNTEIPPAGEIPQYIKTEALLSKTMGSRVDLENDLGEKVPYGCPDCGGPLWLMKNDENQDRYRCHTGHGFTEDALIEAKKKKVEESLWIALRMFEEKLNLLKRSLKRFERNESRFLIESTRQKIKETQKNISTLKEAMDIEPPEFNPDVASSLQSESC